MARRPDDPPPSLPMVAVGGIAVLVMVAFVGFVAFGSRPVAAPAGSRVAVAGAGADAEGDGGMVVAVARCPVERVTSVAVRAGGRALWRITSAKGSIDERYVVGASPPTGFEAQEAAGWDLAEAPDRFEVVVVFDRDGEEIVDRAAFRGDALAASGPGVEGGGVVHLGRRVSWEAFEARSSADAACPSASDRGLVSWLFAMAAGAVFVAYLGMVLRWWGGRRS